LIGRLASYARVNEYGFIETPYRRVVKALRSDDSRLLGRTLRETLKDENTGEIIAKEGERITEKTLPAIRALNRTSIFIAPFVTDEVEYLSADAEDKFVIAQANSELNLHDELWSRWFPAVFTVISSRAALMA